MRFSVSYGCGLKKNCLYVFLGVSIRENCDFSI